MTIDPIATSRTQAFSESVRAARETGVPSSPPQEVFSAMLTAAKAADRLQDTGRALRFSVDESTGLSVHLTDLDGTVLGTVPPSTVISVASGGTLD